MTRHWTALQQPFEWGDGSDIRCDETSSSSSSEISRRTCRSAYRPRPTLPHAALPPPIRRFRTCLVRSHSYKLGRPSSRERTASITFKSFGRVFFGFFVCFFLFFLPSCKWKRFRLHFAFESCKTGTNNRPANHPYVEDAAIFEPTTSSDKRPPLGRWTAPALDWWSTLDWAVLSSWNNFRSLPLAIPIANFVPPRPTSMPGKTLWKRTTTRWAGASTRKRSAGIFRSPDPPPCGRATGRSPDTTEPVNGVAFDR